MLKRFEYARISQEYLSMWQGIINNYKNILDKSTQLQARSMCLIYKVIEKVSIDTYLDKASDLLMGRDLMSFLNVNKSTIEKEYMACFWFWLICVMWLNFLRLKLSNRVN